LSQELTIALDVMGGDQAPAMVLQGAAVALKRFPQIRFMLFGAEDRVKPLLDTLPTVAAASLLIHASGVITGDAKPSVALRTGRHSSMRLAIDAVAAGKADCGHRGFCA